MSSPDPKTRRRFLAFAAVLPLLAGCSFSPLYGGDDAFAVSGRGFAYSEPANRFEQIIYQELAFRLGTDPSPDATLVTVSASKSTRRVGRTSPGSVLSAYEAKISASMSVASRGEDAKNLLSVSRFASTGYEISGQVFADRSAEQNAAEQAARSVADTLRLVLAAARNNGEI
jgi:hypothetical protein